MPEAKPYNIPKQLVWDAYQRVKANRGAAGVDGESLATFEQDLKSNLYKAWNRMSSGSYFPPPVRLVEIEKDNGGTRPLGIPTVADRVCQTVAKMVLEPLLKLYCIYYEQFRTHLSLNKDTPISRPIATGAGHVVAIPQVGGLHHRYERQAA